MFQIRRLALPTLAVLASSMNHVVRGQGEASLRFERPAAQGPGTAGFQIVSDPTIRPFEAPGFPATISTSLPIDFRRNGRPGLLACYVVDPPHPKHKVPCRVLRPQADGSVTDVTRQMLV